MSYTTSYTDETGRTQDVTISDADSREALKNDYNAVMKAYNPKYVQIQRVQAAPGEELHLQITVHAPTHYLRSQEDTSPKPCSSMTVDVIAYLGYPLKGVSARYPKDRYLASPNVFRSGNACIDSWIPFTSSLQTVVEKLVMDMIHNPVVTRYDSMANSAVCDWHKNGVSAGNFPTVSPRLLYAPSAPALPARRAVPTPQVAPPPLPGRKR